MSEQKRHVLIDGDLLVFSICAAVEYKYKDVAVAEEWDDADWLEFLPEIIKSVDAKINFLNQRLNGYKYTVFFSGKENYRFHVMPEYKANRETVWRPANLKVAISETMRVHNSMMKDGLEADDLLAHYQKTDGSTCIVTLDKDLLQCRGAHYRWETEHQGEKFVSVVGDGHLRVDVKCKECGTTTKATRDNYQAASKTCESCGVKLDSKNSKKEVKGDGPLWFLYQCLIGDPTDGIMGCGILTEQVYKSGQKAGQKYTKRKGIGSLKAFEILNPYLQYKTALEVVKAEYTKLFKGSWVTELLKQGRCLYMIKLITKNNKFRMWHFDNNVAEYYDPIDKVILDASELVN